MALSRNDALSLYGGGPSRRRSRGCVTVREPAKGFFITGSSVEELNGIYIPVRSFASILGNLRAPPQIAYVNDNTGWLLVLTRHSKPPMERRAMLEKARREMERRRRRMQEGILSGSETESEEEEESDDCFDDEDDEDEYGSKSIKTNGPPTKPEWCFVDLTGRERFAHEGNTIIPGSGLRWKHLHRPPPQKRGQCHSAAQAEKTPEERARAAGHFESLFYECREDGYETPPEDELALAELSKDKAPPMRRPCTDLAKADPDDENELPWQVIAILDLSVINDLRGAYRYYKRQIAAAMAGQNLPTKGPASLEGVGEPGCWSYRVVEPGGVEVKSAPSGQARLCDHRPFGSIVNAVERRGPWLRLNRPGNSRDELWVQLLDRRGRAMLEVVEEEDFACLTKPPEECLEAEAFDRPFEPRLVGCPEGEQEAETAAEAHEESLRRKLEEANDAHKVSEPSSQRFEEMLKPGMEATLEGVSDETKNGAHVVVVAPSKGDGHCMVRLTEDGSCFYASILNIRRIDNSGEGDLGRASRILDVPLEELGLGPSSSSSTAPASGLKAQAHSRLERARRAAVRDALQILSPEGSIKDIEWAQSQLLAALAQLPEAPASVDATQDSFVAAPHSMVEAGFLGLRAALAARAAAAAVSPGEVEEATGRLRLILGDEQRRIASEVAGLEWPLKAADLGRVPPESDDALLLRLTITRALLRCRREEDALREARAAVLQGRGGPIDAAAKFWLARCLLRLARRDEALTVLQNLTSSTEGQQDPPNASSTSAAAQLALAPAVRWGRSGGASQLAALKLVDSLRARAQDFYSRGAFDKGTEMYSQALSYVTSDDKWGRATLHTGRAACQRRHRALGRAVEDCDAAIRLFPRYTRAHFRRGLCLLELGKPQLALKAFQHLLALDRSWPRLCEWLVRAHSQAKRQESAAGNDDLPFGKEEEGDGKQSSAQDLGPRHADDLYGILGVSSDATEKQLKTAYRMMSLKYHPDKQGGSTRAFQLIATAYQTLSDADKRRAYDEGADVKKPKKDDDSDSEEDEKQEKSLFEEVERRYFPERYHFWPFGDPFIEKRKIMARRRKEELEKARRAARQAGRPWQDDSDDEC
mmetsp:Transcript_36897/g.80055  ORF Transcript_36897/g.80055 Transcript_36897/m.80055 type:complete len:1104 (-) Transcript_36897:24-3335(-)|eukprot:CAMPEP_0206559896 /NCGR_PEP_ID=MMETSP0325_2-20121206/20686_1 /ASSEMBLY_ACC=CAM_ASM_000347 /TAXON_ID=2866 /ORGANISM="Crypthecodinium cohnii, Strain Seligo" /LENGTH=1103 /DNA_ID=CAMNT_0054061523 /DNA_START=31 /DNA_END=3342 /DNA_ORIENTATION=+